MRAIFFDRDGVINANGSDDVLSWDQFRFLPGARAALARPHAAGIPCFVVTNQACVGRGMLSEGALGAIHRRMCGEIQESGGHIEAVAYCPHCPDECCGCRKPRPGMLLRLADTYGIDLRGSYMVGDSLSDLMAGASVGCHTLLVLSGRGQQEVQRFDARLWLPTTCVVSDVCAAVDVIMQFETRLSSSSSERVQSLWGSMLQVFTMQAGGFDDRATPWVREFGYGR